LSTGKPVSTGDAANTGYVPVQTLAQIFQTARKPGGVWANSQDVGGMMGWKFHSDPQGAWIKQLKIVTEGRA
jgi:chitinase